METRKSFYARGGTPQKRTQIKSSHTLDDINKFLIDAAGSKSGIEYKMEPIWKLLMRKFGIKSNDDKARAMNLEAYYKGYLDFGCSLKYDDKRKIVLRKFDLIEGSFPTLPKYHCVLQPEGCHSNDD